MTRVKLALLASLALLVATILSSRVTAHEFWIVPESDRPKPGERLVAALPVTLTWQSKPVAGHQLSVFRRILVVDGEQGADLVGSVIRTRLETDTQGRALVPVQGGSEYVLNTVHIEPADGGEAMWASHWASLSFAVLANPSSWIRDIPGAQVLQRENVTSRATIC